MNPKALTFVSVIRLALALAVALVALPVRAQDSAQYEVRFERTWSSQTHPTDFPLLAHFSPVIGVTHGASYGLFRDGAIASDGVEKLCEEGKHQPLDAEIRAAIGQGVAGALIETAEPIKEVPAAVVASFTIDARHPLVSIAAMIAPSPDWCAVAAEVNLRENGQWVATRTVALLAWDAGTDSGTSYRGFDRDTQPHAALTRSDLPYFARDGQPIPVGQVTFVRK